MNEDFDTSIFWDGKKTLTHNKLFNVIIGNRGGGKSYGCKKIVIDNFINKGEQFGYIRRYKDDLKDSALNFFNDVSIEYPDYEFKVEGNKFYMRMKPEKDNVKWKEEDICGYSFILSTASNKKSISYPKITTLIFDEFLLETGFQRYVPEEPIKLLNLYETIARPSTPHPRVVLFMLANAISVTNPYFLFWDLKMPTKQDKNGKWIWKHPKRPILVEDVRNDKFIEMKRESEFGSLVEGTKYADYSIDNKFLLDDDVFIAKKTGNCVFYFSFIYKGLKYGCWKNQTEGLFYVSNDVDETFPIVYSITTKDHQPNTMLINDKNHALRFRTFIQNYKLGNIRFENINIKNMCYEILKLAMNV